MHLFIVGEQTLPVHLEYNFVGVTKPNDFDWNNVTVHPSAENSQAGMYADICRVHAGDEILLYLEKPSSDKAREGGRFIGIFEAVSPRLFYEPNGRYLNEQLGKPLIYRLEIQPKIIYPTGVSEWQAMDEMTDFKSVHDIPWTIIYRKMTGSRGCTPLLPHEGAIFKKILDLRNHGQKINNSPLQYNFTTLNLEYSHNPNTPYTGVINNFQNIQPRLLHLMNHTNRKWESHLQAYLMQELKRNIALTNLLFPQTTLGWLGNEIYCGAGMQRIDILAYSENQLNKFIHLIELKSVEANADTASQINRYIKWLKAHIPDISIHQIIPTVIAPSIHQNYNDEVRIYLRGQGISQFRNIIVDNELNFTQTILTV
tara:strand:+ start:999 stop:2108 length:1110 start_codon:yes stop_codon:yes gene_type:complete